MARQACFYLIRYADHTLDVALLAPSEIDEVEDHENVISAVFMGSFTRLQLSREALYLLFRQ